MALQTMIQELTAARKAYDDKLASLGEETGKAIAEFLAAKLPPGFYLKWTAFTPYFNDGSPCEFSVNTPSVYKLTPPEREEENEGEYEDDEDDDDEDEGEEVLSLDSYYLNTYGQPYTYRPGEPNEYKCEAVPEVEGLPRAAAVALAEA